MDKDNDGMKVHRESNAMEDPFKSSQNQKFIATKGKGTP